MVDIRPLLPCSIAELQRLLKYKSYARFHEAVSGKRGIPLKMARRISRRTGIPVAVMLGKGVADAQAK